MSHLQANEQYFTTHAISETNNLTHDKTADTETIYPEEDLNTKDNQGNKENLPKSKKSNEENQFDKNSKSKSQTDKDIMEIEKKLKKNESSSNYISATPRPLIKSSKRRSYSILLSKETPGYESYKSHDKVEAELLDIINVSKHTAHKKINNITAKKIKVNSQHSSRLKMNQLELANTYPELKEKMSIGFATSIKQYFESSAQDSLTQIAITNDVYGNLITDIICEAASKKILIKDLQDADIYEALHNCTSLVRIIDVSSVKNSQEEQKKVYITLFQFIKNYLESKEFSNAISAIYASIKNNKQYNLMTILNNYTSSHLSIKAYALRNVKWQAEVQLANKKFQTFEARFNKAKIDYEAKVQNEKLAAST